MNWSQPLVAQSTIEAENKAMQKINKMYCTYEIVSM